MVAAEEEAGALGAVSMATVLIMGIALLSLACVVFLVVYFALHQPSEIEEVEEEMGATIKGAAG